MPPAIAVQNFTENGWGLTRAPPELVRELRESLHNGLPTAKEEGKIDAIDADALGPLFIHQQALNTKVLHELRPMHEAWSGVPLQGAVAYGLRVYRNTSVLRMHVDKLETHIISCILHVDHSEDSEPWPIYIEDYQGNSNEVVLESGDMLFYESSKCIHGRPQPFKGSWYSSLFVHYYPQDWDPAQQQLEAHYAVPPHWSKPQPMSSQLESLSMVGTSMQEHICPNKWCGTKDTVKWRGPAKDGLVISTGYPEGRPLPPSPTESTSTQKDEL
eukprot:CAMPEP_0116554906 /NCGR_PEP_ID=MMETSP0397-20121206/7845_1 /TAXON_ID=216820 /ORGANISM="Cyclophora tenuis, Strain ECT3854" /LENGTH=271 /DNA_ID=CAMNT_0004080105 /DNA_START=117 /DNA_END=932 /DNA_ORIENTATION=-